MPLTLTIRNTDRLDNGSPLSLILDRRGAIIGRAPTSDWCLPDASLHISSRHCEISFADDSYILTDVSTNGTFLNGQSARLPGPHLIAPGDIFHIGQYEIAAALDAETAAAMAARNAAPVTPQWQGWDAHGNTAASAAPASLSSWDSAPSGSAISGTGPMSQSWAPPKADMSAPASGWGAPEPAPTPPSSGWGTSDHAPTPPSAGWGAPDPAPAASDTGWGSPAAPAASDAGWGSPSAAAPSDTAGWGAPPAQDAGSTWNQAAPPASTPASDWSSPVTGAPATPPADDIWGQIAASNVVDWARGGFGTPAAPPALNPHIAGQANAVSAMGLSAAPLAQGAPSDAPPAFAPEASFAAPAAASAPTPAAAPPAAPVASGGAGLAILLASAGLAPEQAKQGEAEMLHQAGDLLRRIIAGLVVMMEARARAKAQMGAQGTSLEFDGNNPLKFARTPEQALMQLLNPGERGFMPHDLAIEDAFRDLQAHQVATLRAMQGALRATLDRFSPNAIRARASQTGVMAKILPGARDAALWQAYEREFSGVAQGSDEAFMDVFSKEFRKAYEEVAKAR